jgi:hypothetical protein
MTQDSTVGELLFKTLSAMEDERREDCIHCGENWYSIHYRDGVCHSCQQKHLPGRAELARRKRHIQVMYGLGIVGLLFLIALRIFS